MPAPQPSSGKPAARESVGDSVSDVVRWAAFSCVLVPVVLVGYGTSLAGAAGTALGLAAVTAACRALLRRSERYAAAATPNKPANKPAGKRTAGRRRRIRGGTGAHRGGRRAPESTPVD
ncbi:hypothetical protein [Streptomyces ureilyticus]|uniref:Uncharacterized protein n=1 Tax=Streptomyces ureilyticus TaxID=1775131 RepID=A0ABX0E1S5_9ACTN|nr:hypothetical protein [Streptomyces ureilyticus]NGO46820.1 hypothetical protein [Streptomyces ureilyticus]